MNKFELRRELGVRFASDKNGNVAMIFAFTAMPLMMLVGLGINVSSMQASRNGLQYATDSAVLAAANSYAASVHLGDDARATAASAIGKKNFAANISSQGDALINPEVEFVFDPDTLTATGTAEAQLTNTLTGLFDLDPVPIAAKSAAQGADQRRIEIVLALDNTGSMASNNRMNLMRAAAKNFVNEFFNRMKEPDKLYIGVVPWTSTVNINMPRPVEDWTPAVFAAPDPGQNGTPMSSWPTGFQDFRTGHLMFPYLHRQQPTLGGQAVTSGNLTQFQTLFTNGQNPSQTWRGCIRAADGERTVNNSRAVTVPLTDAPPTTMRWQAHSLEPGVSGSGSGWNPQAQCPPPMLGLSASREQILRALDRMRPDGNTYQDLGVMWGLRMLSPRTEWANFFGHTGKNRPEAWDPDETRKILILLTDGENVIGSNQEQYYGCNATTGGATSRGGGGPCWRLNTVQRLDNNVVLDNLMKDACKAAREDYKVELYTIAVDINNTTAINLLRDCAGGEQRFENIDAAGINSVMMSIAEKTLRITR